MKRTFSLFFLAMVAQCLHAHPALEHHVHDSAYGEWAWLIIPSIAIIALAWFYANGQLRKNLE